VGILTAVGCAIPGRLYVVAPEVSGVVHGRAFSDSDARLSLRVMHRESAELSERREVRLSPGGEFVFEPLQLAVAGHEYSKYYRAFLHLRVGREERVIWRAEFSRREAMQAIRLACDVDRPVRRGQPCRVLDPLQHPWLIASGKRTYRRLCASCHGDEGRGDGPAVSALAAAPPDLTTIAARRDGFDRDAVAERIEGRSLAAHGTRAMPVWGARLSAEYQRYPERDELVGATLGSVVTYLESLQHAD
jgi:mono/diheme cytochrome c family protein